jgi:toxin HigB-1
VIILLPPNWRQRIEASAHCSASSPGRHHVASGPNDMAVPSWRLHPLQGDQKGRWAVWVDENWRLTFAFEGKDAVLVDYEDYH